MSDGHAAAKGMLACRNGDVCAMENTAQLQQKTRSNVRGFRDSLQKRGSAQ